MSAGADAPDGRAVEYVLGTLPVAERDAVARELVANPDLAEEVRGWEERLASLADNLPAVEPSPKLWARLSRSVESGPDEIASPSATIIPFELARLRRSRAIWRAVAAGAAAVAASLALVVTGDRPATTASTGLVAVVNRSGELPALIVRVDPVAGTVQVRSLAAETPDDRSLELWSIVGTDAPRSLGTIDAGARRVPVPVADRQRLDGATIAVTVEARGGSPTGGPAGPVVYSGKLVSER